MTYGIINFNFFYHIGFQNFWNLQLFNHFSGFQKFWNLKKTEIFSTFRVFRNSEILKKLNFFQLFGFSEILEFDLTSTISWVSRIIIGGLHTTQTLTLNLPTPPIFARFWWYWKSVKVSWCSFRICWKIRHYQLIPPEVVTRNHCVSKSIEPFVNLISINTTLFILPYASKYALGLLAK